jgi:site-specific DNA-adenine methylase
MNKDLEVSNLEEEFKKIHEKYTPEIQEKLEAAAKLINEAEALSETHGLPFRPQCDLMFCNPSYLPESLEEKFPNIDREFVMTLTDAYANDEYPGWQTSQIC